MTLIVNPFRNLCSTYNYRKNPVVWDAELETLKSNYQLPSRHSTPNQTVKKPRASRILWLCKTTRLVQNYISSCWPGESTRFTELGPPPTMIYKVLRGWDHFHLKSRGNKAPQIWISPVAGDFVISSTGTGEVKPRSAQNGIPS